METCRLEFPSHKGIEIFKDGSVIIEVLTKDLIFPEDLGTDDVANLFANEDDGDLAEIFDRLKIKLLKNGIKFTFTLKPVTQSETKTS
jgi:hypothetical protein